MANVVLQDIWKQFGETQALQGVSFECKDGEFFCLLGPSGAGKSTLLHLLGLLDDASEGEIFIDGQQTAYLNESQKSSYRLRKLGYIFQEVILKLCTIQIQIGVLKLKKKLVLTIEK